MRRFAALALLCALAGPAPAAQTAVWTARAGHAAEAFTSDRPAWRSTTASIQRQTARGSALLEAGATDRGSGAEPFAALDLYRTLGARTYANLRAAAAPGAARIARADVLAEVYTVPSAWELSGGVRHLTFADTQIGLATLSAARYAGPWVARARAVASAKGRLAVSGALTVRHVRGEGRGTAARFAEVMVGQGQEPVVEAEGQTTLRRSWVGAARVQQPLGARVGLSVGAGYTADGTLSRWAADVGLAVRL
jgi:YaiO family outer membrane protein